MKTLKFLLGILLSSAIIACDEEDEKTVVNNIYYGGAVTVEKYGDEFELSWTKPMVYTNKGTAIFTQIEYNVYAKTPNSTDLYFIKTVDWEYTTITEQELQNAIDGDVQYLQFFVEIQNPIDLKYEGSYCVSDIYDVNLNNYNPEYVVNYGNATVDLEFTDYNRWFVYCYGTYAIDDVNTRQNEMAKIIVPEGVSNFWDVNFCNIFSGLAEQEYGNEFSMSFDVFWNSSAAQDSTYIHIWSGMNTNYQFSSENTELLREDDPYYAFNTHYAVANNEWTHISCDGIIGEKGAERIGIQMYMAEFAGTFYIANMNVRMGTKTNLTWWPNSLDVNPMALNVLNSDNKYLVSVIWKGSGIVLGGGGYYNAGDIVELTAVPNEEFKFAGWQIDGSSEIITTNPLRISVTQDIKVMALFELDT